MKHKIFVSVEGQTAKGLKFAEQKVIHVDKFNVEEYRKEIMREHKLNQCVVKKFTDLGLSDSLEPTKQEAQTLAIQTELEDAKKKRKKEVQTDA